MKKLIFIKSVILVVLSLFLFTSVYPENNLSKFRHFSSPQGLDAKRIDSLVVDDDGFLWIGTSFGLIRYDGYKFEEIRKVGKSNKSILRVDSMYKSKNKAILLGTIFSGLFLFDLQNYYFKNIDITKNEPELFDKNIAAITIDKAGNVWSGTGKSGIVKFNNLFEDPQFINETSYPIRLSDNNISALLADSKGNVWIATDSGLNKFDINSGKIIVYKKSSAYGSISSNKIRSLYEDSSSRIWVGTRDGGLNLFDVNSNEFKKFKFNKLESDSLSSDWVSGLCEDLKGNIWVGTIGGGINILNPTTGKFKNYRNDKYIRKGLGEDCSILSIVRDNSDIIWIGTYSRNLYSFDYNFKQFDSFYKEYNKKSHKYNENVWSIIEDNSGNSWIGTDAGLNRFNQLSGKSELFTIDAVNEIKHPFSNRVRSILIDKKGNIWVGFYFHGLFRFDPETKEFISYKWIYNEQGFNIGDIFEDSHGFIWIGILSTGVIKFDPLSNKTEYFLENTENNLQKPGNSITTFYEDFKKRLWLGTFGSGLKYIDKKGEICNFVDSGDDENSLSEELIISINGDKEGNLFIGSYGGGFYIFNPGKNKLKNFTIKDGLPGNTVYGVLKDENNNLWLSTNKGISRFQRDDQSFQNYSFLDGLPGNEFNGRSFYKNRDGKLYFGGTNGFILFDPEKITNNSHIPEIVITKFRKFGNKEINIQHHVSGKKLYLSYKDSFSIEFSALDFSISEKNEYAYKLEGTHENWVQLGTNRSITFNNLNPGEHELTIIGSNCDGVWNKKGRVLKLIVKPPFWMTFWFLSLIAIIAIVIVVFYVKNRLKRLERKLRTEAAIDKFIIKSNISEREKEIIELVVKGKGNKEIGDLLFISTGTVKNHLHNIYTKLNIGSRSQIISIFKKL